MLRGSDLGAKLPQSPREMSPRLARAFPRAGGGALFCPSRASVWIPEVERHRPGTGSELDVGTSRRMHDAIHELGEIAGRGKARAEAAIENL